MAAASEPLRGATRSGEVKRGHSRRHYANLRELKTAHSRLYEKQTLYLVGRSACCCCIFLCEVQPRFFYPLERPSTTRNLALSEAILRVPATHPNIRSVLFRAFSKLFKLYADSKEQTSFDVVVTGNLAMFSPKMKSWYLFFGQDFPDGKSQIALSTVYRVDSLSDINNLPISIPTQEFSSSFDRTYADTDARVDHIVALVFLATKILPNYATDAVVGNKMTKLF